jgi:hypothetical protein
VLGACFLLLVVGAVVVVLLGRREIQHIKEHFEAIQEAQAQSSP